MSTPLSVASRAQAQAAVQGWQKTVSAAWDQQQNGLAGVADKTKGQDDRTARWAFFDSKPPRLGQRKIIKTGAIIPGGKDGIIVNRFYIKDKYAAGGALYGDGRGPSTHTGASSRVIAAWDTRTGEVAITVTKSTLPPTSPFNEQSPYTKKRDVAAWPIKVGPKSIGSWGSNNFDVKAVPGGLNIKYDLINSGLPDLARWGAVQGQASVSVRGDQITGTSRGEQYPDREVIQYRAEGARLLNNIPMGSGGYWGKPVFGTDYDTLRDQWKVNRQP